MNETIKMSSGNPDCKLTALLLNGPKCLTSKAKPDKNECIKNHNVPNLF